MSFTEQQRITEQQITQDLHQSFDRMKESLKLLLDQDRSLQKSLEYIASQIWPLLKRKVGVSDARFYSDNLDSLLREVWGNLNSGKNTLDEDSMFSARQLASESIKDLRDKLRTYRQHLPPISEVPGYLHQTGVTFVSTRYGVGPNSYNDTSEARALAKFTNENRQTINNISTALYDVFKDSKTGYSLAGIKHKLTKQGGDPEQRQVAEFEELLRTINFTHSNSGDPTLSQAANDAGNLLQQWLQEKDMRTEKARADWSHPSRVQHRHK